MAARKPRKSRKKVVKRKKRRFLIPALIAGVVLVTIVSAFIVLVLKPFGSTNEEVLISKTETTAPLSYEEPGVPHTVVVETDIKKLHPKRDTPARKTPAAEEKPLLAIVIDDMGYKLKTGNGLLDLDLPLSFAFLPSGPHLDSLAKKAHRKGRDVLLHFPLEPADSRWNPGPGALFISMDEQTMKAIFKKNLAALPLASGINNHMGSRFTQNRQAMKIFLEMVRENNLYFLDSMTSRNSVGYFMAREMGVRTAKRNVFLDNDRNVNKIKKQLRHLLDVADKKGWAIGIGHPYPVTLEALKKMLPEIKRRVNLVGVSRMVH